MSIVIKRSDVKRIKDELKPRCEEGVEYGKSCGQVALYAVKTGDERRKMCAHHAAHAALAIILAARRESLDDNAALKRRHRKEKRHG